MGGGDETMEDGAPPRGLTCGPVAVKGGQVWLFGHAGLRPRSACLPGRPSRGIRLLRADWEHSRTANELVTRHRSSSSHEQSLQRDTGESQGKSK